MQRRFIGLVALGAMVTALTGIAAIQPAAAAGVTLKPGTIWKDTSGTRLQAHGAGVFKVGSTYYMVGEDKIAGNPFTAVACYSSTDLANWKRQTNALSRTSSGDLGPNRVVERPKVIYNSSTKKYVMWMHIDDIAHSEGRAGVATSSTPCGPYSYQGASQPLGHLSKDLGLFKDTDGTAYLMSEDRAAGLRIDKLSADYTSAVSATSTLPDTESPAIVKLGSRYFIFASHLTGWNLNDNVYATATSLAGPWSSYKNFAPTGTNTFSSQVSSVVPVTGTSGTTYLYIGDRWVSDDLYSSAQVWLPMNISGSTASMPTFYPSWSIDAAAGTWSAPKTNALVGQASGRCLDVPKKATANGTALDIWDCNGGTNQTWVSQSNGELQVYGNKCLSVPSKTAGTLAQISDCTGGTNQQWTVNSDGTIVGKASGLCLDVVKEKTANGTGVEIWDCNGKANQKWTHN